MSSDPLNSVSYQDRLTLAWHPLEGPDTPLRDQLAEQNVRVLSALAVLEERRTKPESSDGVELEVERLHVKLDVLLELMAALLRTQPVGDDTTVVRLSAEGACWSSSAPPLAGQSGLLVLHLHPCVAQPFRALATVTGVHDGLVCARFESLSEPVEVLLHKHVFLHHRRSIAVARQPQR